MKPRAGKPSPLNPLSQNGRGARGEGRARMEPRLRAGRPALRLAFASGRLTLSRNLGALAYLALRPLAEAADIGS